MHTLPTILEYAEQSSTWGQFSTWFFILFSVNNIIHDTLDLLSAKTFIMAFLVVEENKQP